MTVLAVAIQKGGTGKTTTTLSLGVELARMGRRVLLIDIDPQSNLTQAVGHDPTQIEHSVYEVLLNPTYGPGFATLATSYGVDLVPATLTLAGAELTLAGRFGRELLLRTALAEARKEYDYILIDSPPSLGVFTVNALRAAGITGPAVRHHWPWSVPARMRAAGGASHDLSPRARARPHARAGLHPLQRRRRPQGERDRGRTELDRLGLPARRSVRETGLTPDLSSPLR